MNYKIIPAPEFIKNIKSLKKRYKNIKKDIKDFSNELKKNPTMGISLGKNVYKVRVKNTDINKGKSAGYRVITYLVTQDHEIYLITIYSKSDKENLLDEEIKKLIEELDLP